ncbi:unnamed protein product [Effrenium voratum]|uniref:Major facilitator superfamily (MFS) profile domain-containing protein n=1 Tax=Effrenium voratum TaxID=2562239 RepID=A0AA36HQC5_9DINO|nr:unnamed protein product [Effrenium voratum]CAJ1449380.1 unnamed protein product [Effrenium voratum]
MFAPSRPSVAPAAPAPQTRGARRCPKAKVSLTWTNTVPPLALAVACRSHRSSKVSVKEVKQQVSKGHLALLGAGFLCWAMAGVSNEATGLFLGQLVEDFQVSPAQASLVVTSFTLGNALGLAICSRLGDKLGRRFLARLGLVNAVCAAGMILTAVRFDMLLLARASLGLSTGLFSVTVPAMMAEGLPTDKVEAYLSSYPSGWPLGALVGVLLASGPWRSVLGLGPLLVAAALLPLLLWLPESPQYLHMKGQKAAAAASLRKLGTHKALEGPKETTNSESRVSFPRMAATFMCRHAASMLVKIWLPIWVGSTSKAIAAMLVMYVVEIFGILATSRLVAADSSDSTLVKGARISMIAGCAATLGCLLCKGHVVAAGLLGAAHLVAQANACNLLIAYATCATSAAQRGKMLARLNLLSFLSGSLVPSLVGLLVSVHGGVFHNVHRMLLIAAALYGVGAFTTPRK